MNCQKCGEPLIPNNHFCTNCGEPVKEPIWNTQPQQVVVYQQAPVVVDKNKQANTLSIISLVLYIAGPIIAGIIAAMIGILSEDASYAFSGLAGLCRIAAYVLVIVARVQCPTNKFSKVLMWIYIIVVILGFVLIVVLIILLFVLLTRITY